MPDTNLIQSVTYLMDCFLDDYRDEEMTETPSELDLRAQVEVSIITMLKFFLLSFNKSKLIE